MLGADAMTTSNTAPRFGQRRVRGQQWVALLAALILTVCGAQQTTAATIHVTTTQQGVTTGQCSLQEAIYAYAIKSNRAVSQTSPDTFYDTGCTAGTDDGDTIVLPPGAIFTFDHFWDGDSHNIFGPTSTPVIFSKIIIEGNGATLQWRDIWAPGNSRLLAIGKVDDPNFGSGTGDLTLRNVYVKDFHIKGGNGGSGGAGGGLGAGGAIYNEGHLTVENSTFENNGAVGGRGSGIGGCCGGGGGLSGHGADGCIFSAGGGGASRGNGGNGAISACGVSAGGGGGGTVFSGTDGTSAAVGGKGGLGGFRCGGGGADAGDDADNAPCSGGGGGGAGGSSNQLCWLVGSCWTRGDDGQFGGGGGGGTGDGGNGGFGGGGGAAWQCVNPYWGWTSGGDGGFG